MNFIEAVQALADGRCEGIRQHHCDYSLNDNGEISFKNTPYTGIRISPEIFLNTDWQLVGEKPEVEEVEVIAWMCTACGQLHKSYQSRPGLSHTYSTVEW